MMIMPLIILQLLLVPGTPSDGALGVSAELVRARHLMGTRCTIRIFHSSEEEGLEAINFAFEAISSLEGTLSTWREDSELSRANRRAAEEGVVLSSELAAFVERALDLAVATEGAFDPTIGPLLTAWKVREAGAVPTSEELARARSRVGHRRVSLDVQRRELRFETAGMWLEAGALGKGLALDEAATALRQHGVVSALLDFGGQLLALGHPPGQVAWRVAVADPLDRSRPVMELDLRDASLATSAQGERAQLVAGRSIGHVMDPRTGEPTDRLGSVTVLARDAATADGLSTAFLVMGPEAGLAWLARQDEGSGVSAAWLSPESGGALRLVSDPHFQWRGELLARPR